LRNFLIEKEEKVLSKKEKDYLLKIARRSIEAGVKGDTPPEITNCPENLTAPSGVFVSIYTFRELRGCIGFIESPRSLIETVVEAAAKAALEDPRFNPLTQDEIQDIELEISVLSPLKEVKDVNEIEVGEHGIVMEQGANRGLLLPQVATEYGWNRETFLNQTARKAGLAINAWKKGDVKIYIFSAEVFDDQN
jgi:AmmeMemoRadiSam system protein A